MAYNPTTGQFDFGYAAPTPTAQPTNYSVYNNNMPTQPNMNFGMGNTNNPTTMGFGGYQQPTQPMNITGTDQTFMNSLMTQPTTNPTDSLFGNVSGTDWLNFGTNVAGLGAGIYYQNQALDQQQQSLDLARDKYNTYKQEQADLDTAYSNFS